MKYLDLCNFSLLVNSLTLKLTCDRLTFSPYVHRFRGVELERAIKFEEGK